MTKTASKWIDFGTGAGQVSAQSLPANFTATNYTPAQVGSEGTDKVSAHLKGLNTKVADVKVFTDYNFTVSGSPQTVFSIPNFGTSSRVDAWVQGFKQDPSSAFTTDGSAHTLTFTEAVPVGYWVNLQVYS